MRLTVRTYALMSDRAISLDDRLWTVTRDLGSGRSSGADEAPAARSQVHGSDA
jgi:hypothetical protein